MSSVSLCKRNPFPSPNMSLVLPRSPLSDNGQEEEGKDITKKKI
jgi:hypothetical protein